MRFKYIIIGAICFILLIVLGIVSLLSSRKNISLLPGILPTPTPIAVTNPQPIVEDKQLEKAVSLLENRQPLTQTDQQTKAAIIATQQPDADTVYSTDTFQVIYIRVADEFQVQIDSPDVKKAMSDAVAWFKSQGMSQDGVCKLPVTFFRSYTLKQQGITVPDLAEGC